MIIDKSQIAQRFAKATQTYNQHAFVQKDICFALTGLMRQFLPDEHFSRVFEIGCGSGNLTQLLLQNFDVEQLYLNDIYPEIQQHFSEQNATHFLIGDVETLEFPTVLDLICSSSALQWMTDFENVVQKSAKALKGRAYFCFSTFGPDNLKEIKQLTGQGLSYLSLDEIKTILIRQGFDVVYISEELKTLGFEQAKDVLKHLKATGVTATATGHRWNKSSLEQFYQAYAQLAFRDVAHQRKYPLTYHPIYCIARRKV